MPSSGWCMLLHKEQHAMGVLVSIPYILWVYGQGITSLKHNQSTWVLSIQPLGHPSCGARFGENCKSTMPSSGWCVFLHEQPQGMDILPLISLVCGCMGKVLQACDITNTLGTCSSKLQSTQSVGPDLVRTTKVPSHPQVGVYCQMKYHMPCICYHTVL